MKLKTMLIIFTLFSSCFLFADEYNRFVKRNGFFLGSGSYGFTDPDITVKGGSLLTFGLITQTGINYYQYGKIISQADVSFTDRGDFSQEIELILLGKGYLRSIHFASLDLGGFVNWAVGSNYPKNYRKLDVGFTFGVGFQFSNLFLDTRSEIGLISAYDRSKIKRTLFLVRIGYMWETKKI